MIGWAGRSWTMCPNRSESNQESNLSSIDGHLGRSQGAEGRIWTEFDAQRSLRRFG